MSLQLFCAVALLVSSCSEAHFCWIYYKFLVHFSTNIKILWKLKVVSSGRSCGSNASWVGTSTPDSVLCRVQAAAVRALWVATQGNCSYCQDPEFRHSLIHCLHYCLHWNIFSDPQQILTIISGAAGLGLGHLSSVEFQVHLHREYHTFIISILCLTKVALLWVVTLAL